MSDVKAIVPRKCFRFEYD